MRNKAAQFIFNIKIYVSFYKLVSIAKCEAVLLMVYHLSTMQMLPHSTMLPDAPSFSTYFHS
jgi:hypothetical protein